MNFEVFKFYFLYFRRVKIKYLKYLHLFLILNCAQFSSAQFLQFQNLTMADGLSHSSVQSIGQDKYGFIWVGTNNGLNIFDGIHFKQYFALPDDESSIPGNNISDMLFYDDSVWIGTRNGLCLMDAISKKCVGIDLGENKFIRTLNLESSKRILWVGTNTGLIKYNIKTGDYQEFNSTTSNISHNTIRSFYEDLEGNMWIGTFDKLNKLRPNSTVFEVFDLKQNYRPNIRNNLVLSISPQKEENDSLLWIGTQTGLVLFNRHSGETRIFREENSGLLNSTCKTLHVTNSGTTWVGTDFGLAQLNHELIINTYLHNPFEKKSIINSTVWDIFEDSSGTIWFGTNNGISILSKTNNRFRFYSTTFNKENHLTAYEISDIIEDSNENIWLATQFGVVSYDSKNQLLETFNEKQPLNRRLNLNLTKNLLEDKKGRIWIATYGGPVIWSPAKKELKTYTSDFNSNNGLRTNYTDGFFELNDGTILVSTTKGLHVAKEKNGNFEFEFIGSFGYLSGINDNYLWSLQNSKLVKIDLETFKSSEEIDFQIEGKVLKLHSILFVEENLAWLGTNSGLIKYNLQSKEFDFFEIKSNKTYPLISIINDNFGNIWASSYSAILKFSTETQTFEIYPGGNEIPISRFTEGCCLKSKNGDLIFGGHDGFLKFAPKEITKSEFISPVKFTRLFISNQEINTNSKIDGKKILNQEISFTKNITFDYASSSFLLEFSSLHFGNRNGIRYAYMLEGEDVDWHYLNGSVGRASYSKLNPGKYILKVRGTNNDGKWNEEETLLKIRIKPPLWASPFFIIFYFILLILITVALFYYFLSRSKMQNELKIAKIRQQFFTNISHEFRTPLSLIIGPIEKLAHNNNLDIKGKSFVDLIDKNARRLLWLTNQLLDFRKLENKSLELRLSEFDIIQFTKKVFSLFTDKAERKEIKYSFDSDFKHLEVKMDLRKIETILFNLLSNAFKFTREKGEITVTIKSCDFNSENGLCISVNDSGIGIPKEDQQKIFERFYQSKEAIKMERGSGIGLTLVNEYVRMHHGKIVLVSKLNVGSEFQIMLPMNVNYSSENVLNTKPETNDPLLKVNKKDKIEVQIMNSVSGKPLILLIEDEKEISDFIRISLNENYNVKVASNGKIAFQIIAQQIPDLVISDIVMPEMDGIEFTKKFKGNPKTAHIPLILLTGQLQTEMQLEGLKVGADAYITKPFEIALLEIRIENFLKRQEKFTEYLKLNSLSRPKDVHIASQDEKLLEKVVRCIEKHISDSELNIDKVCSETGLSHSVLYRKIKNLTGQTVNEFIRTVRVRRAEQLLRTKKFSVSEVAYETGFSNHSYFTKCFRKLYKMTPKEFIEQV